MANLCLMSSHSSPEPVGNPWQPKQIPVSPQIYEQADDQALRKGVAQDVRHAEGLLLGARGLLLWAPWNNRLADPGRDPSGVWGKANQKGQLEARRSALMGSLSSGRTSF